MKYSRCAMILVGCVLVGLISLCVGFAGLEGPRMLAESETHLLSGGCGDPGGTHPCAQTGPESNCKCQMPPCNTIECSTCWYYGPGMEEPVEMLCQGQAGDTDLVEGCFDKDATGYECEVSGPVPSGCTVDAWPAGGGCTPPPVDSGPVRGGDC